MRILFLVHRVPYPPNKGEKIRAYWELQELSKHHQVDLFCFYDHAVAREDIEVLQRLCSHVYLEPLPWFWSRMRAVGATVINKPFTPAFFYSPLMARHIRQAVARTQYDLLFVYSSAMAQYVAEFSSLRRLLDIVDADSDKWEQYAEYAKVPVSWLWRRESRRLGEYETHLLQEFECTIVTTPREAAILKRRAVGATVRVLENRLQFESFEPGDIRISAQLQAQQPYVVFTGSMDYLPNVDAVEYFHRTIFPLVRKAVPELHFVIAGRNPVSRVRRLAKDPSVWVTGSVADIRPYLRGALAAVAPMRIACGVQCKILEALAAGLPVISTSKPASALPARLRLLVQVEDDPARFAAQLVEVARDGAERTATEIRGRLLDFYGDCNLEQEFADLITGSGPPCETTQPRLELRTAGRESGIGGVE